MNCHLIFVVVLLLSLFPLVFGDEDKRGPWEKIELTVQQQALLLSFIEEQNGTLKKKRKNTIVAHTPWGDSSISISDFKIEKIEGSKDTFIFVDFKGPRIVCESVVFRINRLHGKVLRYELPQELLEKPK
ncbi:MAG: hypothetical protein ACJAQT_004766 [Akkermansiaceae bacterium]|jgi:hypothetical protein